MRPNPHHAVDDPEVVRTLIRENPWAILVSRRDEQLVASHYAGCLRSSTRTRTFAPWPGSWSISSVA